jgi:hypothetical protein
MDERRPLLCHSIASRRGTKKGIRGIKQQSTEIAGNNDFVSSLTRPFFPTCNMHKTFV